MHIYRKPSKDVKRCKHCGQVIQPPRCRTCGRVLLDGADTGKPCASCSSNTAFLLTREDE